MKNIFKGMSRLNIKCNFNKITGKIKPMHGVGQPPFVGVNFEHFHYLTEAGIPYSRLHDVRGWFGGNMFVDIPNIFRDFNADETKPESYDFTFTDMLLQALTDAGVKPFFRLGVTIENFFQIKAYRIYPPADFEKWARICEHIIRHYNEGWANGFRFNIEHWEIWNEPDSSFSEDTAGMWKGTDEEFYRLYEITAKHLKNVFGDSVKVGGYASMGFVSMDKYPNCERVRNADSFFDYSLQFLHGFFEYITSEEHKAPIDFFSWHSYDDVHTVIKMSDYCDRLLKKYGLSDIEVYLNEWNPTANDIRDGLVRDHDSEISSSRALAVMLAMQKRSPAMLNYYDARLAGPSIYGMFNPLTKKPYKTYYAFSSFNKAYILGNECETSSDDENVFVVGACNEKKAVLLIANTNSKEVTVSLAAEGADVSDCDILITDSTYLYTDTGRKIINNELVLPPNSCVELRFLR